MTFTAAIGFQDWSPWRSDMNRVMGDCPAALLAVLGLVERLPQARSTVFQVEVLDLLDISSAVRMSEEERYDDANRDSHLSVTR